jgi:hypothetical protein
MKSDPLQRLLAAARRCPPRRLPAELPWPAEARLLALWRNGAFSERQLPWLGLVRRAWAASLVMVGASLVLYLCQPKAQSPNELAWADAMIKNHVWP